MRAVRGSCGHRAPSAGPDAAPAILTRSGCGQGEGGGQYERQALHQGPIHRVLWSREPSQFDIPWRSDGIGAMLPRRRPGTTSATRLLAVGLALSAQAQMRVDDVL